MTGGIAVPQQPAQPRHQVLANEMQRRDAKKGLATLCIGGGMGVAMCLER